MSVKSFSKSDINPFFGLSLDNLAVLILLLGLITGNQPLDEQKSTGRFVFSPEFVVSHMIPGTALGVLIGDLIYSIMALRLARKLDRPVTAMPLGLDTPSTFGVAFLVLLPALAKGHEFFPDQPDKAQEFAWHVGLVVLVITGIIKVFLAPFGNLVRRLIPRASLLGSLCGVALALIAFLPLINDGIASNPLIGMVTLGLMVGALVANLQVLKMPGVLGAVLVGCLLAGIASLLANVAPLAPGFNTRPVEVHLTGIPWVWGSLEGSYLKDVIGLALERLPVIFPFALATIVGGIDCTESAAAVGDEYDTTHILFTEALASLVAGIFGGVIQTTPYIGQPAYKKMGGLVGYTLMTALFIGIAGCTGLFYLLEYVPNYCLYPILVYVGIEITAASFLTTNPRHLAAVALALLPALAYLMTLGLKTAFLMSLPSHPRGIEFLQTLRCVGNGFLLSSILWSAMLVMVLDRRLLAGAIFCLIAAVFSFFGLIHSPLGDEHVGFPWTIMSQVEPAFQEAIRYQTPWHWMGAYLLLAAIFGIWRLMGPKPLDLAHEHGALPHPVPPAHPPH